MISCRYGHRRNHSTGFVIRHARTAAQASVFGLAYLNGKAQRIKKAGCIAGVVIREGSRLLSLVVAPVGRYFVRRESIACSLGRRMFQARPVSLSVLMTTQLKSNCHQARP